MPSCEALKGTLLQPNLWQKLQNLEVLKIDSMSRMEYVFESEGLKQEQAAFRNWRKMKLAYLRELKSIWNGPPQYAIFHNLKTIFPTDASHCLMQLKLEELRVNDCSSLETIIGANEGTLEDKIIFPQLRYMSLRRLPELKSIWNGPAQYAIFHNLKVLRVRECRKLKTIFTTDASHCLMQLELEELRVNYCSSLETIIGANEGTLEDKIIFPQLRYMSLRRLPELKSFYSDGSGGVECPSLEYLNVHECHSQFSISASDFHSQKQVQVDTGRFPLEKVHSQVR
ncbi:hypothetical protein Prudu_004606 [Prunus dulcis]|uniref:Disease resistance protein At4g27190-like leucine-rich repeats domain-containing protein n=1 Tax=Prunus dulcis TaxID=3755 RepID=A0A4Y1QVS0_PRUDU|nr:hypothetical protein Prudu_004606 [Prunus dulcis]